MKTEPTPYRIVNPQFDMVFCTLCRCSFVGGTVERYEMHEKNNHWRHEDWKLKHESKS